MLPAVRQALGLSVYHSVELCQPHAWQLYRHISVYKGDNACLAGRLFTCVCIVRIVQHLHQSAPLSPPDLHPECTHASTCMSVGFTLGQDMTHRGITLVIGMHTLCNIPTVMFWRAREF